MADVSKITVGNTTYDLKDTKALHANGIWYGTCTTAKATADKVATLNNSEGFSLATGVIVAIKFTYASCAAPMTLAVNSTAAKVIMQYGTTQASDGTSTTGWAAGATVIFIYDGTNWVRSFWSNTTYSKMTQAEADTGTATSARSMTAAVLSTTITNKITGKEDTTNKVTTISSSSTDTQYPSAKCVYDIVGDIETLLSQV